MSRPGHNRVILDLAVGEEPIGGWVQVGDDPPRRFTGWLSLSAALDGAREVGLAGADRLPDDEARPLAAAEE